MAKSTEHAEYRFANELGGIETLDARYQHQNFANHTHEGYTIGVVESGAQRFYRSGGDHIAPKESIILVNADDVHNGSSAAEGGWAYKALYPLPEQFAQIRDELALNVRGAPYFPSPVVQDKQLSEVIRTTLHTLMTSDNRLLRESLLYTSMVQLMLRHGKQRSELREQPRAYPQLDLVKSFLDDQPTSDISLEDLATLCGLSPFYLLRQFQARFGLPPHAYQIQARLRLAKKLIRQGLKLSDVALESGFHDQSHMHRHFKKAFGITPGQYGDGVNRKSIQAASENDG